MNTSFIIFLRIWEYLNCCVVNFACTSIYDGFKAETYFCIPLQT